MAVHQTVIFVLVVIIACNAILYPSLFSTIFRMWFGFSTPKEEPEPMPEYPPHMRGRMPGGGGGGGGPPRKSQFSSGNNEAAAYMARQRQEGSSHGMMGTILPVYAVGIFIYFGYVIYKIFLKDRPAKEGDPWGQSDEEDTYGPTLERQQEENLQRQLAAELRAANYDGMGGHRRRTRVKGQPFAAEDEPERTTPSSGKEDIDLLKRRLEQTEKTMDRMMEMMNNMGVAFNRVTEQLHIQTDGSVRQSKTAPREEEEDEEIEEDISTEEEEEGEEDELDEESWSEPEMDGRRGSEDGSDEVDGRIEDIKMKKGEEEEDGSVRRRKVGDGKDD